MSRARHVAVLALALILGPATARADDALAAEARRRNEELVQQGFNLTHGLTVTPEGTRLELLVPPDDGEHTIVLWFAAASGEIAVRLVGPGGDVLSSWRARSGEQRLARPLAAGKYVLEAGGARGWGLVGVKGAVIGRCALDAARVSERPAQPALGFHWPYLLVAPSRPGATTLLVLPNNTGFPTDDLEMLRASATCQLRREIEVADRLGVAVLMPLFPRPRAAGSDDNLYLHALSRAALATRTPALARVDLQLIAMIDAARGRLGARVLIAGFSAAGSFANRFTVLHPDRVLAAAVGAPGGWPIAPVAEAGMTYPVGIADVAALTGAAVDLAALRRVELFFFLGAEDRNDAVPYRDSFSAADEALVMQRFGATPVARWDAAQRLYREAGLSATFRLYPGAGHEVTPEMSADVEAAFRAALR
jgi:dienelactone hydrolase